MTNQFGCVCAWRRKKWFLQRDTLLMGKLFMFCFDVKTSNPQVQFKIDPLIIGLIASYTISVLGCMFCKISASKWAFYIGFQSWTIVLTAHPLYWHCVLQYVHKYMLDVAVISSTHCTAWVKKKLTGIDDVFKNKQMTLKCSVKHIFNKHSLLLIIKQEWNKLIIPKRSYV